MPLPHQHRFLSYGQFSEAVRRHDNNPLISNESRICVEIHLERPKRGFIESPAIAGPVTPEGIRSFGLKECHLVMRRVWIRNDITRFLDVSQPMDRPDVVMMHRQALGLIWR
jgi:hypothetical protein